MLDSFLHLCLQIMYLLLSGARQVSEMGNVSSVMAKFTLLKTYYVSRAM